MEKAPAIGREQVSEPQRELSSFIDSMTSLIGPVFFQKPSN
jgi:hypothetical protein